MMKLNKKDFTVVAQSLVDELKDNITGVNEDWLFGKRPSENVMIGMIDGQIEEGALLKSDVGSNRKFDSIPSIGIRFRVDKETSTIRIKLKGKLFYRVRPTFDDQIRYMIDKYSKVLDDSIVDFDSLKACITTEREGFSEEAKDSIVLKYKSFLLEDFGEFELDLQNVEESIDDVNAKIQKSLYQRIDSIREESIVVKKISRKLNVFLDETKFNELLDTAVENCVPNWEIQLSCKSMEFDRYKECILQLVNKTNKSSQGISYETAIFNGGLIIESSNGFMHIDLNDVKHYYLDKPSLPAIGNNCSVIAYDNKLETENIPICEQKRVVTEDRFNKYIEFDKLIEDPVSNLMYIYDAMCKKKKEYDALYNEKKATESERYLHEFKKEIDDFQFEINRFKGGIDILRNMSDVRKAFLLMNQTFGKNKKYSGWRMFQIVFIVSEIADMIYCEYKDTPGFECRDIDNVDLIYFPTGGGKTEAFLGCAMFAGFFDRIRGKINGVTAIIKYPLRLLAAQQLDRVLKLVINANQVKEENNIEGECFSVGFYTGSGNTPNKIDENRKKEIENMPQETVDDVYRQIDVCPKCGKDMHVYFDGKSWRMVHQCSECGYIPPIYIVDDEIYRFAPTFVISTIDKMASIGTSLGFKALLGQAFNRCEDHGFLSEGKYCKVPNCRCYEEKKIERDIERKDAIPTLFIQDELHLVNESLGTFDSHYESLIQYYCEKLVDPDQRKKIKYIGATATISDYKSHIKGLYNKDAKMFPTSVQRENFYSTIDEDDVCRIIIGAALYGGSITESVQKIVTFMRIIVSGWLKDTGKKLPILKEKGFTGTEEELKKILQYYLIAIVYNNSKNDAGTVRATLENQGNNMLMAENLKTFDIAEITGDIEFKTIKNVIHEIEKYEDKNETKNIVIATSAISHGVDEDSFNQIYFFGMPNKTAEYIQAYSRVGRTYTGIVFDIFRIIRDRDKSFLKNFYNYHDYKDRLIDPVPINRYARNAIYSTLPGIISGLLYQHYAQQWVTLGVTKAINSGALTLEKLLADVEEIYDCNNQDSKLYKEIIDEEVTKIYNAFENNTNTNIMISNFIQEHDSNHKSPMSNLRDVDVALNLELK